MRPLIKVTAALAVVTTAAAAMAMAATTATAVGVTNVITPSTATAQGWYTEDGAPAFDTSSPRIHGLGQLRFDTPVAASKENYFHLTGSSFTNGVGWSSAQGLSYSIRNNGTGPEAAYDMEVLTTGTSGYTTLVWEPYQNGHPLLDDGNWHTFSNLEGSNSLWWSSHIANPAPGSQSSPQPLSFFESLYPSATISTYGVGQGSNNGGSTTYVDDVAFNGVTNNFEPDATTACVASAVHIQAPRALIIGQSNGAVTPCATDSDRIASVHVVIIPGIGGVSADVGIASTSTGFVAGALGVSAGARADVASVVINAVGLHVVVTGLHAQSSSTVTSCGPALITGSSSVASLSINGAKVLVGSQPITLQLGLGLSLSLNQHLVEGNTVTQRALLLTGKTGAYRTALAEAISGVAC